jgi:transposase InsO family protein
MSEAFVYLAVLLDGFSRHVAGWALADRSRAELALSAFAMTIGHRHVTPSALIHRSDRGVQYARGDYIARLERAGVQPSMSRARLSVGQRDGGKLHADIETGRGGRLASRGRAGAESSIEPYLARSRGSGSW